MLLSTWIFCFPVVCPVIPPHVLALTAKCCHSVGVFCTPTNTMDGIERKKQESKLRREASRKSALEPTSSPAADGADDAPAKRIRKSRKGSGPESRTFGGLSGVLEDINVAALPAQLWAASGPSAALLVLVVQNLLLRYAEAEA